MPLLARTVEPSESARDGTVIKENAVNRAEVCECAHTCACVCSVCACARGEGRTSGLFVDGGFAPKDTFLGLAHPEPPDAAIKFTEGSSPKFSLRMEGRATCAARHGEIGGEQDVCALFVLVVQLGARSVKWEVFMQCAPMAVAEVVRQPRRKVCAVQRKQDRQSVPGSK